MARVRWSNPDAIGLIAGFLHHDDPRSAEEQFNERYAHGGGFSRFDGFELREGEELSSIKYPGDGPLREISRCQLRDESIRVYQGAWVAIVQPSGEYAIARMD